MAFCVQELVVIETFKEGSQKLISIQDLALQFFVNVFCISSQFVNMIF